MAPPDSPRIGTVAQHQARMALLADGPRKGERRPVSPGQLELTITESFDYDQGTTEVDLYYAYEAPVANDPYTVIFIYRGQNTRP